MRKSLLSYLVFRNIVRLLLCIAGSILTGLILIKLINLPFPIIEIFVLAGCTPATSFQSAIGYEGMEQFQSFQFCRKRIYQYEVIISIISAVVLAFVRAMYQTICYKEIVRYFAEDTVVTEYHRVPFLELFITSVCIFIVMNLTNLILHTMTIHFLPYYAKGESLQLKQRVRERKEQSSIKGGIFTPISIVAAWIVWSLALLGTILYYELEMRVDLPIRIGVIMALVVVCVILYMVGKKRFKPEYI